MEPASYEEGELARSNGWGKDMNPYDEGSPDWKAWNRGYADEGKKGY